MVPHVVVETNWVVAYAAPAHHRVPAACSLLERAASGELQLYLPAICISEARKVLLNQGRFRPEKEATAIREYIRWAVAEDALEINDAKSARLVVEKMVQKLKADRAELPSRLLELSSTSGLTVFGLSERMLQRTVNIASEISLNPFDQSILAAVLELRSELQFGSAAEVYFATTDSDLQPWNKEGEPMAPLVNWYDNEQVWVFGDFLLQTPSKYDDWPPASDSA